MRPRVFPAEDSTPTTRLMSWTRRFNEAAGIPRGRLVTNPALREQRAALASMRPRVFPAEDMDDDDVQVSLRSASMRPRVFPAEDTSSSADAP